jgi:hypothetical protein
MKITARYDVVHGVSDEPTVRSNLQAIADVLGVELGDAADAGLALTFNQLMPVTISPGRNDRLAVCFQIAEVSNTSHRVWVSALSEAASWGLDGETLRFAVVNRYFVLLWTPAPMPPPTLVGLLYERIATAIALAQLARNFPP